MISVKIPVYKCLLDIEDEMVKAGMPPINQRYGMMRSWYDPTDDTMTYEYFTMDEVRISSAPEPVPDHDPPR
jgi:hypothetical protein